MANLGGRCQRGHACRLGANVRAFHEYQTVDGREEGGNYEVDQLLEEEGKRLN